MSIDVSVIVPAYNAEKYIQRCINSISNQSHKSLEIIIVNDGSVDNTANIIDEMAQNDSRVQVVHKKNEGQGAARNDAIELARGKYISFVDADDWLEQNAYEILINLADKNKTDILVFNYYMAYFGGSNECIKEFANCNIDLSKIEINEFLFDYFFKTNIGSTVWNKLYRTDFLKRNKIQMGDSRIGEDFYFNLVSTVYAKNIYLFNQPLYYYFQPLESVTRNYTRGITKQYINYLSMFIQVLEKEEKLKEFYPFSSLIVYRAISNGVFNAFQVDGKISSIYKEINNGMDNKYVKDVLSIALKGNFLTIIKPKSLKFSVYILFIMLKFNLIGLAAIYQWVRCKRKMIRKQN